MMSEHANVRLWISIVKPLSSTKEHTVVGFRLGPGVSNSNQWAPKGERLYESEFSF